MIEARPTCRKDGERAKDDHVAPANNMGRRAANSTAKIWPPAKFRIDRGIRLFLTTMEWTVSTVLQCHRKFAIHIRHENDLIVQKRCSRRSCLSCCGIITKGERVPE